MGFEVDAPFEPAGGQPEAIRTVSEGFEKGLEKQTLLGVTGSGKTNTVSWVIENLEVPTLVIAHNKTLAAQLYDEFRELFPDAAVEYFVSYYDYYQPEAYVASSDTYIGKDASINEEIQKLRHSATNALLTRDDVVVVSSVSAIYGLGDPDFYRDLAVEIEVGEDLGRDGLIGSLVGIQYERADENFQPGRFRVRGDTVDIYPMYSREAIRVEFWGDQVESITAFEPLKNEVIEDRRKALIHPASHYSTPDEEMEAALSEIEELLEKRIEHFEQKGDAVAAQRIEERTRFDIEMMKEAGYCSGIENYAVHLSDRESGEPPYTLLDYFPEGFLTVLDESHQTVPQIKGQYAGDRSRKESLVENGFRLPTAYDNRPLTFEEFEQKTGKTLYVSATPGDYEEKNSGRVAEQIVRPTYLLDPTVEIRETEGQVEDLIGAISDRVEADQRVLVTTLSTEMAENLTEFLEDSGVSAQYMHHETDTLQRHEIIKRLRKGELDTVVGINLLREGLDIPEVSLVAILEADQEGFLRSETTLVQTMGRAARNRDGHVVLYADRTTDAIENAVSETKRRRQIQKEYNEKHGTEPATVEKQITESDLKSGDVESPSAETTEQEIEILREKMEEAAEDLEFEKAAMYRDRIKELQGGTD